MKKFVWLAEYCFSLYETGYAAIGVCGTRKKARAILSAHRKRYYRGGWQRWRVVRREVL